MPVNIYIPSQRKKYLSLFAKITFLLPGLLIPTSPLGAPSIMNSTIFDRPYSPTQLPGSINFTPNILSNDSVTTPFFLTANTQAILSVHLVVTSIPLIALWASDFSLPNLSSPMHQLHPLKHSSDFNFSS